MEHDPAFDVLAAFGVRDLEPGADAALVIGVAGAGAAAITGYAEWSDTEGEPRRLGADHAVLNSTALLSYIASYAVHRSGRRTAGAVSGMLGYALVGTAAFLGGELACNLGLGVKHTSQSIKPDGSFRPVCAVRQVADGKTRSAISDDIALLLTRSGDAVSAVSGICTHRGAPLRVATSWTSAFGVHGMVRVSICTAARSSPARPHSILNNSILKSSMAILRSARRSAPRQSDILKHK